jgi:aconitate hydratase
VPVDLVVDHSVQVDFAGSRRRARANLAIEFKRNRERYQFLKWGMQAFDTFKVVPPGIGIVHQVNLEYLAKGVLNQGRVLSRHAGRHRLAHDDDQRLGIVGWGVGGIEAEAGMLGQPVYFLTPDVVGVHLTGALREGVTATDLALTVTSCCARRKVVGKFVEFFGPGAAALPVVTARPSPTWRPNTARRWASSRSTPSATTTSAPPAASEKHIATYEAYYKAQGLWGIPQKGAIDYSQVVELDLATVVPSVAGPKRPQDRIELPEDEARRLRRRVRKAGGHRKGFRQEGRGILHRQAPTGRRTTPRSATAPCSSPPSRAAPTPPTRASCSPPACSPRRPSRRASR